jgi:hypothetical protein
MEVSPLSFPTSKITTLKLQSEFAFGAIIVFLKCILTPPPPPVFLFQRRVKNTLLLLADKVW